MRMLNEESVFRPKQLVSTVRTRWQQAAEAIGHAR